MLQSCIVYCRVNRYESKLIVHPPHFSVGAGLNVPFTFFIADPPLKRLTRRWCGRFDKKDRLFVAILYTSESDKVMRYTDEVRP